MHLSRLLACLPRLRMLSQQSPTLLSGLLTLLPGLLTLLSPLLMLLPLSR